MNINSFIKEWLTTANSFDTQKFLSMWHKDATLDDSSVGEVFEEHAGIQKYFEEYFIGYNTQTRLIELKILSQHHAHLVVEFTGNFPGKKIGGTFDLILKDGKIKKAKAELI